MTNRSAKRTEFLNDILSTALEGGINYWVDEMDADLIRPSDDAFTWFYREAKIVDIEGDEYTVDINTIVKGLNLLVKRNAERDKALILCSRTNGDDGDYDALDADKIVQFGLFGELVFA